MIKFTVITITKNSGSLLNLTASSLYSQTFSHFEWIIVDASTNKDSRDIVDLIVTKHDAHLIRGQDSCISEAWNIGIRSSNGAYILLLNAGDAYSSHFLELCDKHASESYILCGTPLKVINDISYGMISFRKESFRRGMTVAHNWMVVPRQVYADVGYYANLKYAMDYEWLLRVFSKYGISFFHELTEGKPHGKYLLGGYSDKHFIKSLLSSLGLSLQYNTISHREYFFYFLTSILKHYTYNTLLTFKKLYMSVLPMFLTCR